jgi:hypothetical protein
MAKIAFGRRTFDPADPAIEAVQFVLRELPKRYRSCSAEVVMRGSSVEYEDWVALEVLEERDKLASSCIEWIAKRITRRGLVIVPMGGLGNPDQSNPSA